MLNKGRCNGLIENFQNIEVLNLEKRSKIIDKPNRNEVILLHVKAMKFEWKQYADFEKNHRAEGREIIVLLPEEMLGDLIQLKKTCDALAKRGIGESRDYEYVIRWNNKLATLHLLFSERKKNVGRTPKIYTRDFWYDKKTNRQTKPHAKNAELRYEEGTFQKDRNGSIKYEGPPFLDKDPYFSSENWHRHFEKTILSVFKEFGYYLNEEQERYLNDEKVLEIPEETKKEKIEEPTLDIVVYPTKNEIASTKDQLGLSSGRQKYASDKRDKLDKWQESLLTGLKKIGCFFVKVKDSIIKKISPIAESIKKRCVNATIFKKFMEFIN